MIVDAKNGIFNFKYKFQPYTNAYTQTIHKINLAILLPQFLDSTFVPNNSFSFPPQLW